ncbi:MAG: S-layer homology domain-containing protein [Clostridiales bacterium]|nr:S-layer homology domain-containing protein [Clostridiales bacterium]
MKQFISLLMVVILLNTVVYAEKPTFEDIDDTKWYSDWVNIIKDLNITSGYPDGTFKPDNQLKRIELLSFTMKSLGYDIPIANDYWGQNIIDKAIEINIISNQSSDLMFSDPEGYITREETARVIYNAYLKSNEVFNSDVDQEIRSTIVDLEEINSMYLQGVVGVFSSGIVEGYADKSFKPKNQLTRAEAAVFISRLALPEKRKSIELELSSFEYHTTSVRANNFKVHYSPEHQDIYNIMTIVDTVENADVENGFAWIGGLSSQSTHLLGLYSNMEDFDYAPVTSHTSYKRWNIEVRKILPPQEYTDWIEITGWRDKNELEHEETMKAVFNYLFAEDSDRIWNKYFEYANTIVEENVGIDYQTESFGRTVRIVASTTGVGLYATRKTDALPVIVEDGKVMVQYASILSDGSIGTVTFHDITDKNSNE